MACLLSCTELGFRHLISSPHDPSPQNSPQGSAQLSLSRSGGRYQAASENPGPKLDVKRVVGHCRLLTPEEGHMLIDLQHLLKTSLGVGESPAHGGGGLLQSQVFWE